MNRCVAGTGGLLLLSVVLAGCGGGNPDARPTNPVTATVLYKGQPVEGATVTFINSEEASPIPAVGRTDAQGKAKMKTYEEGDGAVIGTHKVMIVKTEITNEQPVAADTESEDYDPQSGYSPPPVLKQLIPRKYGAPGTSGLTVQVTDTGEPLEVTFELQE